MGYSNLVIVVPVYKLHADNSELYSLQKLAQVTNFKYDIIFVKPIGMLAEYMKQYYDVMPGWEGHVFEMTFDDEYFKSTETYSKLCKEFSFYLQFQEYKYMLIYQLDCLLLNDNLDYWCSKGYDYIGAPILGTGSGWRNIPCVGNGGLSLRKISSFLAVTNPDGEFLSTFKDDINEAITTNNDYEKYEDLYFAELVPDLWSGFTKPNYKIALEFAWDRNPQLAMSISGKLPMGLHAWQKFRDYYKDLIQIPE